MTVLPIAPRIAVLGSGAWGTALALSLARTGRNVTLWAHSPEAAREILDARENVQFLPGFPLPPNITVTGDNSAVAHADIVVSVVPSEFLRSTLARLSPHIHAGQILLSATKGVENGTFLRMTQVIADSLAQSEPTDAIKPNGAAEPGAIRHDAAGSGAKPALSTEALAPDESRPKLSVAIGALSGPSFAQEVAEGQPTAVTVAFDDPSIAALVQREFSSETLRIYTSTDVIGIELGGALKNVIAIAAGIAAGMGLGYNSSAALITRGIAEITRLAVACGGRRETLAGLSGVGDLVLTCTGTLSRNRTVGVALGQGLKLPEILASLGGKVAEGVHTTRAALGLARQRRIEMPIAEQMELILEEGKDPREAIRDLMLRPGKHEH
jgi:glycerol-3-phosphate dehydrogenase (NAD(P)+)